MLVRRLLHRAHAASTGTADDDPMVILSDAQDFNQNTGKMAADGNVKVYYQDTIAVGPKAIAFAQFRGRAEKVIFTGRSQISQPGKRWIADRITMAVASKKVLAEGNTKAFIISCPGNSPIKQPEKTALSARPVAMSQLNHQQNKLPLIKIKMAPPLVAEN